MRHMARIDTIDTPRGPKFFAVCANCGACTGGVTDESHALSLLTGDCPGREKVRAR